MRASACFSALVFSSCCLASACNADRPGDGENDAGTETQTDASTGTDSDTEGVCDPPANASPEQAVPITVRNDRDVPIYLRPYSSFGCNYGKVEIDIEGAPVLWHHGETYAYNCSGSLCDWGCSDGGAMGWIINPGATAQLEWSGARWVDAPLPEACAAEMNCANDPGDTCEVLTLVEEGTQYTVRVNLSETCPVEDECMACDAGVCEVFFYEPGPGVETIEASAVFPAGLEVVVD